MRAKYLKTIFIILILVTILTSCKMLEKTIDNIETPEGDKSLEILIGCLESHEYSELEDVFLFDGTKQEFESGIKSIDKFYDGEMISYKKVGYHVNSNTMGGETTNKIDYTYEVETTEDVYYVSIVMIGNKSNMYINGININTKSAAQAEVTPSWVGSNSWQIIILVYSVLCIMFIIYAIVSCAKSKVRLKWLWIIGILVQCGISITIATNNFRFNVHVVYLGISRYLIYKNGAFVLTIVFPLVAFLFVILRKHLIKKAEIYCSKKNNSIEAEPQNTESLEREQPNHDCK